MKTSRYMVMALLGPTVAWLFAVPLQAQETKTEPAAEKPAPATKGEKDTTIIVKGRTRTVTNKIDRRVYDVSANPQSGFASLREILSNIPSVTIDPRGAIALRGDSHVKILIDGKPANPAVMRSLTAAMIARIEVITNPSAQYSSEGSAGIINIILKKKRNNGWNVTWNARSDFDGRYNLDASTAYKRGKWSINTSAGLGQDKRETRENGLQTFFPDTGDTQETLSSAVSRSLSRQWYANVSVENQLTDHDTFNLTASTNMSRSMAIERGQTTITDPAGSVLQNYSDAAIDPTQEYVTEFESTYEHQGAIDGETLTLDLTHTHTESPEDNLHLFSYEVPALPDTFYRQVSKAPETDTTFKADYERPFANGARLTTGVSIETQNNKSRRTTENIATVAPLLYDDTFYLSYTARSAAGYATYQIPLGRWTLLPGIRIENEHWNTRLQPNGVDAPMDYTRWLPSLHVRRSLTDHLQAVASYSHRTQKPTMYDLNPAMIYFSRQFAHVGNADLKPQDTDSFEIGYEYEDKTFSSNGDIYYRKTYHPLVPTRAFTEDQVIIASSINASHSAFMGAEYTAKGHVTPKLQYAINLNIFDAELVGLVGAEMLRHKGTTFSGNTVLEYTFRPKDWLQLTYTAQGKTLTLQGYTTGFERLDFVYRHKIGKKWNAVVRGMDVLNGSKQQRVFVTPDGQALTYTRTERPGLLFGLSYKLGGGQ